MPKVNDYKKDKVELSRLRQLVLKLKIVGIFAGSLVAIIVIAFVVYSLVFKSRIYYGLHTGNLKYSYQTKEQVLSDLKSSSDDFLKQDIQLTYGDKKYQLKSAEISLAYNPESSADNVYNYARSNNLDDYWKRLKAVFVHQNIAAVYTYNTEALTAKINSIAKELDQPEKDYSLSISGSQVTLLTDRAPGKRLSQDQLRSDIFSRFDQLQSKDISLVVVDKIPQVSLESAELAKKQAEAILAAGSLTLTYQTQQFTVDINSLGGWITTIADGTNLLVDFDRDKINAYLQTISPLINSQPQDAMLAVVNGVVTVTQQSSNGVAVDYDATIAKVLAALRLRLDSTAELASQTVAISFSTSKPSITQETLASLGLKDLISTGTTSFTGSPKNRISNITVGAKLISGALIKPGETFSTLGRLGKIDASSGFLPELVIKDNKTVPEFGGGLCQVSTTLFRAAMNAGLEIVARQNHSYRVSYYEPPVGMDATIYDPAPDFKFKNDTPGYILVQGKVTGTKITFEFYGTKDGRTVSMTDPVISDVTPPPPPIMENTDTLPVGTTKQTEKAHDGATASFTYTVMLNGQQLHKNTFVSHYVPWQAHILVGTGAVPVDPNATPAPASPDTGQPAATPTT